MKLCVIAYEGHFRIMQLAIRQALKYLPVDSIEIFWDDTAGVVPVDLPWSVTPFSAVVDARGYRGYIAHEFVKLSLHRVIDDPSWIVMDADVLLRNSRHFDNNVWYYDPDESGQEYWAFLKYALDIDPQPQRWMTPIWRCERSVLEALDTELHQRHGADLETVFERSGAPLISEAELYAYFATQFLEKEFCRQPHELAMTPYFDLPSAWTSHTRDICFGGRDDWNLSFWHQWPEIIVDIKTCQI